MADIETNLSSVEEETLSSNSKRPMINESSKQIAQMKTSHSLPTSEGTPDPETARIEADKERRQAETTKELSNQLHPEQASNTENLTIEPEHFANNAQGNEDHDDGPDAMKIEQSEASKSNDLRQQIYAKATSYLGTLMKNPQNAEAIENLESLNKQIKQQNLKDKLSQKNLENFLIKIPTFVAHFEMIKDSFKTLQTNPGDDTAREILIKINEVLEQLNERHDYSRTWLIDISSKPDTDELFEVAAYKVINEADKASTKNDVKTKVGILISNESNDRTSLEMVVNVRKAEYDLRVIVNRDTEKNPFYEIYLGADFGKEVAQDWLEYENYRFKNLPKGTATKQMKIYERVKVRRTKPRRTQQTQYYLINVENKSYITARSTLSGMKGLSPAKLQRIDAEWDRQNAQLLIELDQCRERNEHPDTELQLTNADIEQMPWLSLDEMQKPENENSDKDESEDEDIMNIVPQRAGLQRNIKPKIISNASSELWA
jgi:hypothetical protein